MNTCWRADANERPNCADIRLIFDAMLERNNQNYGYVKLVGDSCDENREM